MSEEQVVKLLEEIRDLQRASLDNQKIAIANQQQSIDRQKLAVENQKTAMNRARTTLYIVVGLFVVMFGLPVCWWLFAWFMHFLVR